MKKLPLADFHTLNGARFFAQENWMVPQHYGDTAREVQMAFSTAGLIDRSFLGKVILKGEDAIDLLNRISTNDMNKLLAGNVCDTIFSTPRGKIVDYCRVAHLGEMYLIISNYMNSAHLMEWINRFIIMEDVDAEDVSETYVWLTLTGPGSFELLQKLVREPVARKDETVWLDFNGELFPAFKNGNYTLDTYDICLPEMYSVEAADRLLEEVKKQDGGLIGQEAFEVVRIQSGMPARGRELTEDYNPYEARLLNAVSFTKGAYTGQETISWLDTTDQVQRYLMIVEMEEKPRQKPPLRVMFNEDPIGNLTSYTYDPLAKKHVGLAYIKRPYTIDGLNLRVEVELGSKRIGGGLKQPGRIK